MPLKTLLPICLYFFFLSFNICFAQQPRLMLPIGHTEGIKDAYFSPNGKYIISATDGGVMLWETASARLLQTIKGNDVGGFAHNGKTIISYMHDSDSTGSIQLIDLLSGKTIDSINGFLISFNKAGDRALISSTNGTIRYWDYKTKKTIFELHGGFGMFILGDSCILTANALDKTSEIYSFYTTYDFKIWNLNTQQLIQSYTGEFAGYSEKYICLSVNGQLQIINTLSGDTAHLFTLPRSEKKNDTLYLSYKVKFSRNNKLMAVYSKYNSEYAIIFDTDSFKIQKRFLFPQRISNLVFNHDSKSIIAVDQDSSAMALDISSGDTLFQLKGHSRYILDLNFSPDGNSILTTSWDTKAILWDASTGSKQKILEGKNAMPVKSVTSQDGKYFSYFFKNTLLVYEIETFRRILSMPMMEVDMYFSTDSRYLLLNRSNFSNEGGILFKKIDILTGNIINDFSHSPDSVAFYYSPDATLLAIDHELKQILGIYNDKLEIIQEIKYDETYEIKRTIFSANKKYCIILYKVNKEKENQHDKIVCYFQKNGAINWTYSNKFINDDFEINENKNQLVLRTGYSDNGFLYVDLIDGRQTHIPTTDNGLNQGFFTKKIIYFSPTGNVFLFKDNRIIRFFDFATGELLLKIITPGQITFLEYLDDNNVFICDWDGRIEVWDLKERQIVAQTRINGYITSNVGNNYMVSDGYYLYLYDRYLRQLCSFMNLGVDDYITLIDGGYYQSTQNASKQLYYVTKDLKTISFEQLDVKYNRPDKVLETIGNTDTSLIKSYRTAFEKRIRKLGIDTTAFRSGFSVPEADFANRDKIEFEQKDGKLKLDIKSVDSTYKLDRFNVWINETPLYGQRGINLRSQDKNSFDSSITIDLSQGENKIETSITNVNGTESYRMPLLVNYTPAVKEKERIFFIGIGIDKFSDSKYNLKYSTKDIRDLSKKLKEKYRDIIIDTLFNENVTVSKVKAFKQKLLQTNVNDKVLISYSGHGMLSKEFDYYLSTYAVNFDKPEENGLPYDELESLLDSIPARKKLMLIDACHSGEVDKDDLMAMNSLDTSKIKRGLKPVAYKSGQLGLKNSFELMQSLFVNVGKSTGATIISAAAGTEFALEGINNLPNGVFTYSILEAMNKYPSMKLSELKKIVGERVVELTKGLQKPTSRNETIAVDWEVW